MKTFSALGVFGASVVTAVTAQNTMGVRAVEDVSPAMIEAQIDAVLDDVPVGATKIGMVSRAATAAAIAERLRRRGVRPVLDPVMVATSGDRLLQPDAIGVLRTQLLPLAALVPPNLPVAALLRGMPLARHEWYMIEQARIIAGAGAGAVLVKGGHATGTESTDILFDGKAVTRFAAKRLPTMNTHGTGCTLSAAITAGLARGLPLAEAVAAAKDYLQDALAAADALRMGKGRGPVHHFHRWWREQ